VKDEGGPLGIGFQERVPNHSKLLRPKSVVVSVGGKKKLGHDPGQVCIRKTNESKPTDDASLRTKRRQNQRREPPLGQVCEVPDDCTDGDRRGGGVSRMLAFARNCRRPGALMAREKHKRRTPRGESTEAEHWDGPISRSDEGPVIGLEQRDRGWAVVWS